MGPGSSNPLRHGVGSAAPLLPRFGAARPAVRACENRALADTQPQTPEHAMDIERINQIGNSLADLSARTEALRRYL